MLTVHIQKEDFVQDIIRM